MKPNVRQNNEISTFSPGKPGNPPQLQLHKVQHFTLELIPSIISK